MELQQLPHRQQGSPCIAQHRNVSVKVSFGLSLAMHVLLGLYFYQSLPVKVSNVTTHYISVNLIPLSSPPSMDNKKSEVLKPTIKPLTQHSIQTQLRQEQQDEALHNQTESFTDVNDNMKTSLFTWEVNEQPQVDRKNLFVYPQHYYNILAFTLNASELVQVEITVHEERVSDYKILKGAIPNIEDFDKLLKFFPIAQKEGVFILNLSKEEYLHDMCPNRESYSIVDLCNLFDKDIEYHLDYFEQKNASASD